MVKYIFREATLKRLASFIYLASIFVLESHKIVDLCGPNSHYVLSDFVSFFSFFFRTIFYLVPVLPRLFSFLACQKRFSGWLLLKICSVLVLIRCKINIIKKIC